MTLVLVDELTRHDLNVLFVQARVQKQDVSRYLGMRPDLFASQLNGKRAVSEEWVPKVRAAVAALVEQREAQG